MNLRLPKPDAPLWKHIRYRTWLLSQPVRSYWFLQRGTLAGVRNYLGDAAESVHTVKGGGSSIGDLYHDGQYLVVRMQCQRLVDMLATLGAGKSSHGVWEVNLPENDAGVQMLFLAAFVGAGDIIHVKIKIPSTEGRFILA